MDPGNSAPAYSSICNRESPLLWDAGYLHQISRWIRFAAVPLSRADRFTFISTLRTEGRIDWQHRTATCTGQDQFDNRTTCLAIPSSLNRLYRTISAHDPYLTICRVHRNLDGWVVDRMMGMVMVVMVIIMVMMLIIIFLMMNVSTSPGFVQIVKIEQVFKDLHIEYSPFKSIHTGLIQGFHPSDMNGDCQDHDDYQCLEPA
jgi:hypothetical protein